MLRVLFIGMILVNASILEAQSPCDWFDHDGDGFIGGNSWLYALSNYGVEGGPMDVDGSGIQDLSDLLAFMPYVGYACPTDWFNPTSGHIIDLAVVEYAVHDENLEGLGGTLPAGSVTYQIFALLENPDDYLLAVYGDEDWPLVLETEDAFYGFGTGLGETVVVSSYQPLFNSVFPANEFTTWFNAGVTVDASANTSVSWVSAIANWAASLDPSAIIMDDSVGGAFFSSFASNMGPNNGAVPVGQFTVTNPASFSGTMNLLAKTTWEDGNEGVEWAEGLTFSNTNLTVFGCMDENAMNYDEEATWQLSGNCSYAGDFNDDGELTTADLLGMLAVFGCTACPQGDINGDGVVNVQDILIFLTWL